MRVFLKILFAAIFLGMIAVTTAASLDRGVVDGAARLWPDLWFRATLADAYAGFVTIFVWIAHRERTMVARVAWFVALMALGNIAISLYSLLALHRLRPEDSLSALLLPRAAGAA